MVSDVGAADRKSEMIVRHIAWLHMSGTCMLLITER